MLDPLPIGEAEPKELKCELCGGLFRDNIECESDDYQSVDETGRCRDCYEDLGDEYPDRI